MIFTKLKALVAVAAVALAAFPLVWADEAKPKPAAARPAAAEKEPQLWLLYPDSGRLVVLRTDGTVARTLAAPEADSILLVSPKQGKVWFRGRDGRGVTRTDPGEGTLHVRAIEPGGAATDLGIALAGIAWVVPDGKTLVMTRVTVAAANDPMRPGAGRDGFENALVDIATKAVTELDHLPKWHCVQGVLANGKSLLTMELGDNKGLSKLYEVSVAGGPPRLVTDKLYLYPPSGLSPDFTKVFVVTPDSREKWEPKDYGLNACVLDLASGKATKFSDEDNLIHAQGRWSADGKRVAYTWQEWAKGAGPAADGVPPTRLVVRDADGKNPKTLVTSEEPFRVVAWE